MQRSEIHRVGQGYESERERREHFGDSGCGSSTGAGEGLFQQFVVVGGLLLFLCSGQFLGIDEVGRRGNGAGGRHCETGAHDDTQRPGQFETDIDAAQPGED